MSGASILHWIEGAPELRAAIEAWLSDPAPLAISTSARRRVFRLALRDGRSVAVKHFEPAKHPLRALVQRGARDPAIREWKTLSLLEEAGLAAPRPLAHARLADGGALLALSFVEGTALPDALRAEPGERRALLAALGRAARALHELGLLHGDLHLGNALVSDGAIVLLDFQRARPLRRAAERLHELGALDFSLWHTGSSLADRVRVRSAALSAPGARAPRAQIRSVGRAAASAARDHARGRTRRCVAPGRRFARFASGELRGLRNREIDEATLHDWLAKANAPGTQTGECCVERGEAPTVVRHFAPATTAAVFLDGLRGGPARREWIAGHSLAARRIQASQPLAWLESKSGASALVARHPAGVPLDVFVRERPESTGGALAALLHLVLALQRSGTATAALRASQVVYDGQRAALSSLSGVRFARRAPPLPAMRSLEGVLRELGGASRVDREHTLACAAQVLGRADRSDL